MMLRQPSKRPSKEKAKPISHTLWDSCSSHDGEEQMGAPAPRHHKAATPEDVQQRTLAMGRVAEMSALYLADMQNRKELLRSRTRRRIQTAPSFASNQGNPGLSAAVAAAVATVVEDEEEDAEIREVARPIVILDWDDTLLPTWYITDVICPCLSKRATEVELDEDSPFWAPLSKHAEVVQEVLTKASEVANVAIVTLAQRPWVETSAKLYLPGLDVHDLFGSLGIKVYYAREHVSPGHVRLGKSEEGCDLFVVAKRNAMMKCIRRLCKGTDKANNVLSIGDSPVEREAIKEVMWSHDEDYLCKTLKLMDDPSVEHLTNELQVLTAYIKQMVLHRADFDISMADAHDLEEFETIVTAC